MKHISLRPSEDFKDNYKLLIGAIVPRPIAVISTRNENGTNNLAPFSFFTACSAKPMIIAIAPMIRTSDGSEKDTAINIKREKEFVVNFCPEDLATQVNQCATELPYGEDEFQLSKLSPVKCELIKCQRVLESPISYECKLRDVVSYGDQPGCGQLITGEVINVHINPEIFKDGKILTDAYRPIGRGAGNEWVKTTDRITLQRLQKAQIQN